MASASIVIIAIIIGIIVLGGLWALSRNRVTGDVPPAKIADKAMVKPEALGVPPVAAPLPPEVKADPKAQVPAAKKSGAIKPAAKTTVTPKPAAPKTAPAKKPAPKKAGTKAPAPTVPATLTAIGVPGAVGAPDNLLLVKGLGPKLNTLLTGLGITRFDQIAQWGAKEVATVDEHLGAFKGRIERDSWVEQAGLLARGAIADFEAKFGKLDSENK
jgi:predicted flap endonuclease-1-like 5' DNA nuclease